MQDFDAEAMALALPAGVVALSWAEADADCTMAIRPRNATNVTLAFSGFEAGTFSSIRVYDGLSMHGGAADCNSFQRWCIAARHFPKQRTVARGQA